MDHITEKWMQQQIIATLAAATCTPGLSPEEVIQKYAQMTDYVRGRVQGQPVDLMNPSNRFDK